MISLSVVVYKTSMRLPRPLVKRFLENLFESWYGSIVPRQIVTVSFNEELHARVVAAAEHGGMKVAEYVRACVEARLDGETQPNKYGRALSTGRRTEQPEVSKSDCRHPITRRIGTMCAICGEQCAARRDRKG